MRGLGVLRHREYRRPEPRALNDEPKHQQHGYADSEREQPLSADVHTSNRDLLGNEGRDIPVLGAEYEEQGLLDGERYGQRDHQHRELRLPQWTHQKPLHRHAKKRHDQNGKRCRDQKRQAEQRSHGEGGIGA